MLCLNCSSQVDEGGAKFFLKVLLCDTCAAKSKALRDRAKSELETVLATLDDVFRHALTSGKLDLHNTLSGEEVVNYALALNKHWRRSEPPDAPSE